MDKTTLSELFPSPSSHQVGGDHYVSLAIQPWEALEAWLTPAEFAGFLRGSAITYLARAGKKPSSPDDPEKALHYLQKLIEFKNKLSFEEF